MFIDWVCLIEAAKQEVFMRLLVSIERKRYLWLNRMDYLGSNEWAARKYTVLKLSFQSHSENLSKLFAYKKEHVTSNQVDL